MRVVGFGEPDLGIRRAFVFDFADDRLSGRKATVVNPDGKVLARGTADESGIVHVEHRVIPERHAHAPNPEVLNLVVSDGWARSAPAAVYTYAYELEEGSPKGTPVLLAGRYSPRHPAVDGEATETPGCVCRYKGEEGYSYWKWKRWCELEDPKGRCLGSRRKERCSEETQGVCTGYYWDFVRNKDSEVNTYNLFGIQLTKTQVFVVLVAAFAAVDIGQTALPAFFERKNLGTVWEEVGKKIEERGFSVSSFLVSVSDVFASGFEKVRTFLATHRAVDSDCDNCNDYATMNLLSVLAGVLFSYALGVDFHFHQRHPYQRHYGCY